jgi:Protein of unknown function (DUF3455)
MLIGTNIHCESPLYRWIGRSHMKTSHFLSALVVTLTVTAPIHSAHAAADPQAPAGTYLILSAQASGWQIYACVNGSLAFSRPYAGLTDEIVHWGPGPYWETYGDQDFSRIRGALATNGTFPNDDPAWNIPDLLLNVISSEGDGLLADTVNIIRRNSSGGVGAVGSSCASGSDDVWVAYTATYEFYGQS